MTCTAYLVCLISTVSSRTKKAKNALGRGDASSGHITKLEQSRLSLDIYGANTTVYIVSSLSDKENHVLYCSPQGQGKPQTIVINKQGTLKNAQGQQIIVVSTAGGLKTVQTLSQVSML
jgi:hypothetical protein